MNREQYRIRFSMQTAGETAEVMIYSEIAEAKFWGDETTTAEFDKAIKEAVKNGARKLNLRVNSPGGEVYAAVAMRSMVINAGFERVRVMIEGLCASAATLFATIPDATVVIASGSEFMIHNPMTITWGNAREIEQTVTHLRMMEGQIADMYAMKTGKDAQALREMMDAETWFTAKETVEAGFADELLEAEPVAACVSRRDMAVMRGLYRAVPETVTVREDVGNEAPMAGAPTKIQNEEEDPHVNIQDITLDDLRAENPALLDTIQQGAVAAERQRIEDIDALTVPGYEAMAAEAKQNGTPAIDFQRAVVAAMKAKGSSFLTARQEETAPAAQVAGGAPEDGRTPEQEIEDNARKVAAYAAGMAGNDAGGMY